jgi:transcriptional regulator with XRE-family HTH domain
MKKPSPEQRKALGSFLASRRARLQPSDFGLVGGRRRTPGLRREEVAVLASVSVSWYTWLEQGRNIQASADTLRRVSDVLKLSRVESVHLFALSSREAPSITPTDELTDGLLMLLQAVDPIQAYIRNGRFDILAWNAAVADLFVDYSTLQPHERNTLRLLFLYPPYRTLIIDWEEMTRGMLSSFSAARAQAQDKTPFDELVEELHGASEAFRKWWPQADVRGFDEGVKRIQHPTQGRVDLTYVALAPQGRPDLSLVTYIPRPAAYESES